MATPEINENCYYVQNDPHRCKIKLGKFHFDIFRCFGDIKESLPGRAESAPPRWDRVNLIQARGGLQEPPKVFVHNF